MSLPRERRCIELIALDERTAGLPTRMARSDVETAARDFEYSAGVADKLHGETIPLGEDFIDDTERAALHEYLQTKNECVKIGA